MKRDCHARELKRNPSGLHSGREPPVSQRPITNSKDIARVTGKDFIAPARSAGASYSETGVSNDQVCIQPSVCLSGKNEQNTEWYLPRPGRQIPLGLFFSRFSRCRRKVRLRGEGMICRDPKKVDFFQFFDHSNYAYIRRPRTIRSSLQPS